MPRKIPLLSKGIFLCGDGRYELQVIPRRRSEFSQPTPHGLACSPNIVAVVRYRTRLKQFSHSISTQEKRRPFGRSIFNGWRWAVANRRAKSYSKRVYMRSCVFVFKRKSYKTNKILFRPSSLIFRFKLKRACPLSYKYSVHDS